MKKLPKTPYQNNSTPDPVKNKDNISSDYFKRKPNQF